MLFNSWFVADWHKIGKHRQSLTDHSNQHENNWRNDYDNKVGDKELVEKKLYSAKQSLNMARSLGLSQQFMQMELSGFDAEPN
jgi:hypothetical protein